jgi:hypothetical protein
MDILQSKIRRKNYLSIVIKRRVSEDGVERIVLFANAD